MMRTTFTFLTLFCLAYAAGSVFSQDWIEFQPPMMDDVTVDPLRFTQPGIPFDLSDPMFQPVHHGQTGNASRSDQTTKDKLVIDYEFIGRPGIEFIDIQTKIKIDKPGNIIGGVFSTDIPKMGAIKVRLRDPSGEIHQHSLGFPVGPPIFAKIDSAPQDCWGGDGDKILQFPCEIVSFLLDKPQPGFMGKGTLEITNLALYEAVELRDVLTIEFAADSPPGLLFEKPGILRFRLTPKNLNEGEVLFFGSPSPSNLAGFPDFRTAQAGKERTVEKIPFPHRIGITRTPFIRLDQLKIDGMDSEEYVQAIQKELAQARPERQVRFIGDSFLDWIDDYLCATTLLTQVPHEGKILEIPVRAPGSVRVVLFPCIVHSEGLANFVANRHDAEKPKLPETVPALPVSFSFGAIRPNMPQDDRLGVCTHYAQGWNTNSMDFAVKAGFGMIRDDLYWGTVERQKGILALPNHATYIDKALENNLEPLLVMAYANRFYDDGGYPVSDEAVAGYANYCRFLAEQFKGKVQYYEVWNEWFIGCGMRHIPRDSDTKAPENYIKLLKATHDAVKAVNPEAYLIGGGGDHPIDHREQMEALFKLGVMNYCDAFSIHPYRQQRTPEASGLVEEVLGFADMMRQHGVAEPKLWITEIGWPTPKKHPAADAELFQAAIIVRSAVPLLALDVVKKYIWYDLKNDGLDRVDQEHNFGIIRHDRLGLQVKPAFVAFAVMSSNTAGRTISKDETLSQDGVYAYRLTKAGEPDRLVLWVERGEKTVQLPAIAEATNLFGTPLVFASESITLTDEPIWIILR